MIKLAIGLLLIIQCSPIFALTLENIRTDTRYLINDVNPDSTRFLNETIDNWINEGQRIADITTLCTYKAYEFSLSSGTTYYTLPSDFLQIRRVTRDYLSIQELTPAALDGRSAEWENQSGLPTYYFLNFSSRTKIGFAPFPNATADLADIKVEYMGYSVSLSNDTDTPFSGIVEFFPYHYSLSFYAAYKASMIDERDNKAKVFLESFTSMIGLMKERCVARPNYLPQMIGKQ